VEVFTMTSVAEQAGRLNAAAAELPTGTASQFALQMQGLGGAVAAALGDTRAQTDLVGQASGIADAMNDVAGRLENLKQAMQAEAGRLVS
jgi:hypothetical protein